MAKPTEDMQHSEYQKIAMATAIGFAIMGFIGFFVKLIHIPINNIIVSVSVSCIFRSRPPDLVPSYFILYLELFRVQS